MNILLIEDNPVRRARIEDCMGSIADAFKLEVVGDYDQAIAEIRRNRHAAYLVSKEFAADRGLEIVWEISGHNCKGPALVLADSDDPEQEKESVNLGAMLYLVRDQLSPRFLERMIRHSIERKRYEDGIRDNQEDLIRRMMDLQDSSERYEAQSVEYIQMAEDLSVAQVELKAALAEVMESKKELEKLNQEKDRFFSIISHDLRSPFTSLLALQA